MDILVVSGGRLDQSALAFFKKEQPVIAVDGGLKFCYENQIPVNYVVGDFDTIEPQILAYYKQQERTEIRTYPPEKDMTDTKAALELAVELAKRFSKEDKKAADILLLGGIGSRMDHTLANIGCLMYTLKNGVFMKMIDSHNCMYAYQQSFSIEKEHLTYKKYLSLLAIEGEVRHLTIRGMKYETEDITLPLLSDWGVSNELLGEQAKIDFSEGTLLVIESRD